MIKILIVDDSVTQRVLLQHLIEAEKDMHVIGYASNGAEAIKLVGKLKPDLITMDINMPVMDGYTAIRSIMMQHPTPIVVISSAIDDVKLNAVFLSLEAGALSALKKPVDFISTGSAALRQQIIQTIRSMSEIKVIRRRYPTSSAKLAPTPSLAERQAVDYEIIAIGASVGGPQALKTILAELPADFSLPIVVVQHMTDGFMDGFANWLGKNISLKVKCAEQNEKITKGTVYFAPDQHHLMIQRDKHALIAKLIKTEPVSGFRPSVTVMLSSVAQTCGKKAIGILLTGMGSDGVQGFEELKKVSAYTLIQDEKSCIVFGMAGVAKSLGLVDKIVNLDQMAHYILNITNYKNAKKL